jgi:hypothetical protein
MRSAAPPGAIGEGHANPLERELHLDLEVVEGVLREIRGVGVERVGECVEVAGVEILAIELRDALRAQLVAVNQPLARLAQLFAARQEVRDLEVHQRRQPRVALLRRLRPAPLLGVDHDLGAGVDLVVVGAGQLSYEALLRARPRDGVFVDRAQLRALPRAHLEERVLEPLREPLLLFLEVEQPLRIEAFDVGRDRSLADTRGHHVDADVLLQQQGRELAQVAAGEFGLGGGGEPHRQGENAANQEEPPESADHMGAEDSQPTPGPGSAES